jgi:hypothetical protein
MRLKKLPESNSESEFQKLKFVMKVEAGRQLARHLQLRQALGWWRWTPAPHLPCCDTSDPPTTTFLPPVLQTYVRIWGNS